MGTPTPARFKIKAGCLQSSKRVNDARAAIISACKRYALPAYALAATARASIRCALYAYRVRVNDMALGVYAGRRQK